MNGQWSVEVQAWNYRQTMHYTFGAPVSAIVQVSLSSRSDFEPGTLPTPTADAHFNSYADARGDLVVFDDWVSTFGRNGMTEVSGILTAHRCRAAAIVNVFFWPHVSIQHSPGSAP